MRVVIRAKVTSGRGKAGYLRSNDVVELSQITGSNIINGSLNLVASRPLWLNPDTAIYSTDEGHMYWKAQIGEKEVLLNRWKGGCPVHIYEVFADFHLRKSLKLKDGDILELTINNEVLDTENNSDIKCLTSWFLFWYGRESLYYTCDNYLALLKKYPMKGYTWRVVQN